jgi:hypothetical protein
MQAQMKDGSVIELVVDRAQDVAKVSPPRSPAIIVVSLDAQSQASRLRNRRSTHHPSSGQVRGINFPVR